MTSLHPAFVPVLRYRVEGGTITGVEWIDDALRRASSVVYARTHGGSVLYIGKTTRTLERRMNEHMGYMRSPTFAPIARFREWAEGKTILTMAADPGTARWNSFDVPLCDGLETALIQSVLPPFNRRAG